MIRRRRPAREIAFSFDSFLDLVANVVGIIIRLILVAWVGARSYSTLQSKVTPATPPAQATAQAKAEPSDPLQDELAQHRRELAEAQALLLEKLRELGMSQENRTKAGNDLALLVSRRQGLERDRSALLQTASKTTQTPQTTLPLAELHERCRRLTDEIRAMEKLPPVKQTLRYRTPVSQEVHSEELMFECHNGRVTFIPTQELLTEVHRVVQEKKDGLRTQWKLPGVVGPIGGFELHYTLERERDYLEGAMTGTLPDPNSGFSYGLSEWHLEPTDLTRGEALDAAMTRGSVFRQIVDPIDPSQTAVTFWVYPDSFAIYRQLRDYLYDRDVMVAGRPLPEGIPITSSRRGSASRGQ